MTSTHEDLAGRLDRLEHDLQELAETMSRPLPTERADLWERIPLTGWLKISGPTMAVMLFGFTLLWNAQQTANAQLLEVSRTLGRLDGTMTAFQQRMDAFDQRLVAFDERMEAFDQRLAAIDERLAAFDQRLAAFDERLAGIDQRLAGIDQRLESMDRSLVSLDGSIRGLQKSVDRLAERVGPAR